MAAPLAVTFAGICLVVFFRQESFVFFPDPRVDATPDAAGMPFERVSLRTADGEVLAAWWIPADGARGAVILAHGNAGNISHRLDKAALFRSLRLSALLFDYRGYGESSGEPTEAGTYLDMAAAVEHATGTRAVPFDRLIYFGESLGGAVAVDAAGRARPAGLVLESAFTSIPAMARVHYPWLPAGLLLRLRYDSLVKVDRIGCPLLILHSPEDDIVPYSMGRALFEAAASPKAFADLEGGHNDGGVCISPGARASLERFLDQVLGPLDGSDRAIE
jgi:hypothetical protein